MSLGERFAHALADEIVRQPGLAKSTETWQEFLDKILKDLHAMEYHPGYLPGPFWIPEHLENALDGTDPDAIAAWSKLTSLLQAEQLVLRRDQLVYHHVSVGRTKPAYVLLYVGQDLPKWIKHCEEFQANVKAIARRFSR